MAVASTETVDVRAEKALAAYIRGHRDSNADVATFTGTLDLDCTRVGALLDLPIHEGRLSATLVSPAVVVASQEARRMYEGADWFAINVEVVLMTNYKEDDASTTQAEVVHAARSKAIDDLICSEDVLKLGLNKPVVGTDSRAVDEFTVHGGWLEENRGEPVDDKFVETWVVSLVCSPWDAVNL